MNDIVSLLGRQRFEDALRRAEADRLAARAARRSGISLRQRMGRTLIWLGTAAGPELTRPANGH